MAASSLFSASEMNDETNNAAADDNPASTSAQALDLLVESLRSEHGNAINAILYYGSCLRNDDPFDGIVDSYLLTDSYRAVYPGRMRAILNWLLPPNVFYRELAVGDRTLRVKYNVVSIESLRRGVSSRRVHSYFWGRLAQPMKFLWSRDENAKRNVEQLLEQAVKTFLERVLPRVPPSGSVCDLWTQGLGMSYAAELRSEAPDRARQLVNHALEHYVEVTRQVASSLRFSLQVTGSGESARYEAAVPSLRRVLGFWGWAVRRLVGKVLSLARLFKALLTFEGGLDYAAWKLARHSGQPIDIPDRVRRYPLIFVWPLLWKLYRRGIIR